MDSEQKLRSKNIETYTGDMAKVLKENKDGLIKRVINEEEEHEAEKKNLSPKSKKNQTLIVVSLSLIIIAFIALVSVAFLHNEVNRLFVATPSSSLIFTDSTDFKPIDGLTSAQVANTFRNQAENVKVKIGGIDGIYLTENNKVVGFKRFNALIESSFDLSKADIVNDNFLLGSYLNGLKGGSPFAGNPFILLQVKSFFDAFPVMRAWERKMLYDLHGFFGMDITLENNYLFTKNFEDGILANKNARVLKDNGGNIILAYVFVDNTYVVIANSESVINEVSLRINGSQIKK